MSTETQKVDVVGAMLSAEACLTRNGITMQDSARIAIKLAEARAAVAELIEAATNGLGWINGPTKGDKQARDRLRAALARVGGAV